MKFSKYNNLGKRRIRRKNPYSQEYINERKNEMFSLLARANTEAEKNLIIKAFHVSINP